jgi:hypothetical protein
MTQAGVPDERLAGVGSLVEATLKARLAEASDLVKQQVTARQKELSRSIVPIVKEGMSSAYERGCLEAGTGSHARRVAIVEGHVRSHCGGMFASAVAPVAEAIKSLIGGMRAIFRERSLDHVEGALRVNYCGIWEAATPQARKARAAIRERLAKAVSEAKGALTRLVRSQGAKAPVPAEGEAGESDDELVDVTESVLKKKEELANQSRIDLCEDREDENGAAEPRAANVAPNVKQEPGLVHVKSERGAGGILSDVN